MKTARDVMTPNPIMFRETEDLTEVTTRFLLSRISSAPIVDHNERALGVLTETGLMKCFLMLYSRPDQKVQMKDVSGMIDPPAYVRQDDSLDKVLKAMLSSKTSRVLVQGNLDKIIGVISPKDILRALSEDLLNIKGVSENLLKAATSVTTQSKAGKSGSHEIEDGYYKKFFENSPYMMHSVDAEGTIRMANKKTHLTLGYVYPELVGRSYESLYLEKYWDAAKEGLKRARSPGEFQKIHTSMVTKKGIAIPIEIQTAGLFDEKNNFVGTMSVVRQMDQDDSVVSMMDLIGIFDDHHTSKASKK